MLKGENRGREEQGGTKREERSTGTGREGGGRGGGKGIIENKQTSK